MTTNSENAPSFGRVSPHIAALVAATVAFGSAAVYATRRYEYYIIARRRPNCESLVAHSTTARENQFIKNFLARSTAQIRLGGAALGNCVEAVAALLRPEDKRLVVAADADLPPVAPVTRTGDVINDAAVSRGGDAADPADVLLATHEAARPVVQRLHNILVARRAALFSTVSSLEHAPSGATAATTVAIATLSKKDALRCLRDKAAALTKDCQLSLSGREVALLAETVPEAVLTVEHSVLSYLCADCHDRASRSTTATITAQQQHFAKKLFETQRRRIIASGRADDVVAWQFATVLEQLVLDGVPLFAFAHDADFHAAIRRLRGRCRRQSDATLDATTADDSDWIDASLTHVQRQRLALRDATPFAPSENFDAMLYTVTAAHFAEVYSSVNDDAHAPLLLHLLRTVYAPYSLPPDRRSPDAFREVFWAAIADLAPMLEQRLRTAVAAQRAEGMAFFVDEVASEFFAAAPSTEIMAAPPPKHADVAMKVAASHEGTALAPVVDRPVGDDNRVIDGITQVEQPNPPSAPLAVARRAASFDTGLALQCAAFGVAHVVLAFTEIIERFVSYSFQDNDGSQGDGYGVDPPNRSQILGDATVQDSNAPIAVRGPEGACGARGAAVNESRGQRPHQDGPHSGTSALASDRGVSTTESAYPDGEAARWLGAFTTSHAIAAVLASRIAPWDAARVALLLASATGASLWASHSADEDGATAVKSTTASLTLGTTATVFRRGMARLGEILTGAGSAQTASATSSASGLGFFLWLTTCRALCQAVVSYSKRNLENALTKAMQRRASNLFVRVDQQAIDSIGGEPSHWWDNVRSPPASIDLDRSVAKFISIGVNWGVALFTIYSDYSRCLKLVTTSQTTTAAQLSSSSGLAIAGGPTFRMYWLSSKAQIPLWLAVLLDALVRNGLIAAIAWLSNKRFFSKLVEFVASDKRVALHSGYVGLYGAYGFCRNALDKELPVLHRSRCGLELLAVVTTERRQSTRGDDRRPLSPAAYVWCATSVDSSLAKESPECAAHVTHTLVDMRTRFAEWLDQQRRYVSVLGAFRSMGTAYNSPLLRDRIRVSEQAARYHAALRHQQQHRFTDTAPTASVSSSTETVARSSSSSPGRRWLRNFFISLAKWSALDHSTVGPESSTLLRFASWCSRRYERGYRHVQRALRLDAAVQRYLATNGRHISLALQCSAARGTSIPLTAANNTSNHTVSAGGASRLRRWWTSVWSRQSDNNIIPQPGGRQQCATETTKIASSFGKPQSKQDETDAALDEEERIIVRQQATKLSQLGIGIFRLTHKQFLTLRMLGLEAVFASRSASTEVERKKQRQYREVMSEVSWNNNGTSGGIVALIEPIAYQIDDVGLVLACVWMVARDQVATAVLKGGRLDVRHPLHYAPPVASRGMAELYESYYDYLRNRVSTSASFLSELRDVRSGNWNDPFADFGQLGTFASMLRDVGGSVRIDRADFVPTEHVATVDAYHRERIAAPGELSLFSNSKNGDDDCRWPPTGAPVITWTVRNDADVFRRCIELKDVRFEYPRPPVSYDKRSHDVAHDDEAEGDAANADEEEGQGMATAGGAESKKPKEGGLDADVGQGGGNRGALKGVTFTIPYGSFVGIVGPSGGGKSTVLKLLKRFYDSSYNTGPYSNIGNTNTPAPSVDASEQSSCAAGIFIDGRAIQLFDVRSLRQRVAWVPQSPHLFSDLTYAENVALGCDCPLEHVIHCCKIAHIHDVIVAKPMGYRTVVSSSSDLSGGERQRLAIARALVTSPSVILLDEATSALDVLTERKVMSAIMEQVKLRQQKQQQAGGHTLGALTVVSVAHRLSTLKAATHVVVIAGGACTEEGTPASLLRRKADGSKTRFREMWDLQRLQQQSPQRANATSAKKAMSNVRVQNFSVAASGPPQALSTTTAADTTTKSSPAASPTAAASSAQQADGARIDDASVSGDARSDEAVPPPQAADQAHHGSNDHGGVNEHASRRPPPPAALMAAAVAAADEDPDDEARRLLDEPSDDDEADGLPAAPEEAAAVVERQSTEENDLRRDGSPPLAKHHDDGQKVNVALRSLAEALRMELAEYAADEDDAVVRGQQHGAEVAAGDVSTAVKLRALLCQVEAAIAAEANDKA